MDHEAVRRLSLARHLFDLASASLKSKNDIHLFSSVNLLQDAVEAFLLAIADHVKAEVDQNTKFDKYFVLINERIAPKELPFKNKLIRLNRIRIDSKHYGIQPARDECDRVILSVREFFEETTQALLGVDFATASAIDLLVDGDKKDLLKNAQSLFLKGNCDDCMIECRKVIYLLTEQQFNVEKFKDPDIIQHGGLMLGFSRAPQFARNPEYIERNVRDPIDYIVIDYGELSQTLLTRGVDSTAYWNVCRLTPEVFRDERGTWVVRMDFNKLDKGEIKSRAEYVLTTTVDIALAFQSSSLAVRGHDHSLFYIELKSEDVPLYAKADRKSSVIGRTPLGARRVNVDFQVMGLDGEGPYWHVSDFSVGGFLVGFIHNDEVDVSNS